MYVALGVGRRKMIRATELQEGFTDNATSSNIGLEILNI